jgi:hypothetical protein
MKRESLIVAMNQAETVFQQLKRQYPSLKGYLVYSSPSGQCDLTDNMEKILTEFPDMIHDSKVKTEAINLINKKGSIEQMLTKKELDIKEDTFIEIRFKNPNLDLVFEMQKDPLVSQKHTPQSQASIRIVFGTLGELGTS